MGSTITSKEDYIICIVKMSFRNKNFNARFDWPLSILKLYLVRIVKLKLMTYINEILHVYGRIFRILKIFFLFLLTQFNFIAGSLVRVFFLALHFSHCI